MTPDPDTETDAETVRVLVISADDTVRGFLVALLERAGFDAVAEPEDRAAVETNAADPPYDLVLVDSETGPVRSIRSLADPERARIPVALLAAVEPDDGAEEAATAAGATSFISRPVEDSELISVLRRTAAG